MQATSALMIGLWCNNKVLDTQNAFDQVTRCDELTDETTVQVVTKWSCDETSGNQDYMQHCATKMMWGLQDLPYEERLKRTNLMFLEIRRHRADLH